MKLTCKELFLLDGLGATLTALLLGQLVARFDHFFGVPSKISLMLAWTAVAFAVYSITCAHLVRHNYRTFLRGIAAANILYCVVTFALLFYLRESITYWGIAYFSCEILIVLVLIRMEWQFSQPTDH